MLVDPTFLFKIGSEVYPEGTHFIISWFERPVIYDIRARPHLVESTSGSRDLQMGALDGGLDIPHNDKRFAGFDKEKKELDVEILAEDEPEKYQSHFSEYIKRGIEWY
ncbi:hypothetical protein JHK87_050674 [Glycine soja]|nr:hypothetical protein JHK87_050674 [Glycine soja]